MQGPSMRCVLLLQASNEFSHPHKPYTPLCPLPLQLRCHNLDILMSTPCLHASMQVTPSYQWLNLLFLSAGHSSNVGASPIMQPPPRDLYVEHHQVV